MIGSLFRTAAHFLRSQIIQCSKWSIPRDSVDRRGCWGRANGVPPPALRDRRRNAVCLRRLSGLLLRNPKKSFFNTRNPMFDQIIFHTCTRTAQNLPHASQQVWCRLSMIIHRLHQPDELILFNSNRLRNRLFSQVLRALVWGLRSRHRDSKSIVRCNRNQGYV